MGDSGIPLGAMSIQRTIRQEADSIHENPVRLESTKVEQIVDALSTDLANLYVLYHQLHKHHWNVEGAEHLEIHRWLQEAYEDIEAAADEVAERIQSIGGVPPASMPALAERATFEPEDEDVYDIRASLEHDRELYGQLIEQYRDHIELVDGLGDYASGEILRDQLVVLEDHVHVIHHWLEEDTLVVESATH